MSLFWIAKAPGAHDVGQVVQHVQYAVDDRDFSAKEAGLAPPRRDAAPPPAPKAIDAGDALNGDVLGDFPVEGMVAVFSVFGLASVALVVYWLIRRHKGRIEIINKKAARTAHSGTADPESESESSDNRGASLASEECGGAGFGQGVNSAVRTATHILTTYVGVGVFSIPFCFAQAGWAALFVLFGVVSLAAYTGTLLGASCRTLDVSAPSYPRLAQRCLGDNSKRVVQLSIIALLLVFQVAVQLTTWEHAYLLLPSTDNRWVAVLVCIALSFMMVWVSDAERLAKSSALGLLCIAIICVLMGCKLADNSTPPPPRTLIRLDGIPMCLAILMTSVAGHVALPPLLVAMKQPEQFRKTLIGSFATIFVIYAFIGVSGYMLFGDDAAVVVNINIRAAMDSRAGEVLAQAIAGGIALKCLCTEPLLGLLVVDLAEKIYVDMRGSAMPSSFSPHLRVAYWLLSSACALALRALLEYASALLGVAEMFLAILLPIVFYYKLHKHGMPCWRRGYYLFLGTGSVLVIVVVGYVNVRELLHALLSGQPASDAHGAGASAVPGREAEL